MNKKPKQLKVPDSYVDDILSGQCTSFWCVRSEIYLSVSEALELVSRDLKRNKQLPFARVIIDVVEDHELQSAVYLGEFPDGVSVEDAIAMMKNDWPEHEIFKNSGIKKIVFSNPERLIEGQ
ncbi:MAG: hypothetical protein HKM24_07940 [Gammaproteobacteria bacterium]|nr:hypothetical protein [Gammaproteobacteria bacterium]